MKLKNFEVIFSLITMGVIVVFVAACGSAPTEVEPQVIVVTATPTSVVVTNTPATTPTAEPSVVPTVEDVTGTVSISIPYQAGTLLQGSGKDIYYLTENDTRQRIHNRDTFLAFGFTEKDVVRVNDELLQTIPLAGELTELVVDERGDLYWVMGGERWLVNEWRHIVTRTDFSSVAVTQADASLLASLPVHHGFEPGTLLREGDTVYYFYRPAHFAPKLAGIYANIIPVLVDAYDKADVVNVPTGVLAAYEQTAYLEQISLRLNNETSAANLRQGPGLDRKVLGIIQNTDPITAYGRTADDLWVLVTLQDQFGWLATDLVEPTTALSLLRIGASTEAIVGDVPLAQPAEVVEKSSEPQPVYCRETPIRGFGTVWGDHPEVQATLGCSSAGGERGTKAAVQVFEHGLMLWLEADSVYSADPVYVFFDDGNYQRFGDLGPADPAKIGPVPTGYHHVDDKFSKVYWEGTGARVKERLGYAIGPASDTAGAYQQFSNGRMFWAEVVDRIFVIYDYYYYDKDDNYVQVHTWTGYEDEF